VKPYGLSGGQDNNEPLQTFLDRLDKAVIALRSRLELMYRPKNSNKVFKVTVTHDIGKNMIKKVME
jgi:hypothetical protein